MIIRNEKDRIRFIHELLGSKLPIHVIVETVDKNIIIGRTEGIDFIEDVYPDTPESTLGSHTSGFKDDQ